MTASEVAKLFGVKRIGNGRKWRAPCPAHKSRGLTLAIYDDGNKVGVHCHAGCDQDDVLACAGLTWRDLKPDQPVTREVTYLLLDRNKRERLNGKLSAVLYLLGADKENADHWEAIRLGLIAEMEPLWWRVMPDKERFDRVRAWELKDYDNRRMDFLRRQHGNDGPRASAEEGENPVRGEERVHSSPPELLPSRVRGGEPHGSRPGQHVGRGD